MLRSIYILLISFTLLCAQKNPIDILIVYHSLSGNTKQMAESVAVGAQSVSGISVQLKTIKEASKADLLSAKAIIVGSPVHNANITPAIQRYINSWPFKDQPLKNKIGAAFVSAGGISAGEELAQMNILHSMLIYNMIVVGGPNWQSAFGASAICEEYPSGQGIENKTVEPYFIQKAQALGKRVAELLQQLTLPN